MATSMKKLASRIDELESKGERLVEALCKTLPGPVAKEIRKIAAE